MIKRLYCAEHEITYYEGGACFYCKQNRERGPKSETQMVDDYRSYTLEVDLEKMPDGWLCFAIGEGKPCIAPPPVMDEIKALVSKLSTLEVERSMDQKLIDSEQGRIKELVGRLDTAMKSIDQLDANLSVVLRSEDEFERRALAAESRLNSALAYLHTLAGTTAIGSISTGNVVDVPQELRNSVRHVLTELDPDFVVETPHE